MCQTSLLQDLHQHPVPKKTRITGLNDYRPVALTSVVMKTPCSWPPLHCVFLQHMDSSGTSAMILFVDFSSALNTELFNPDCPL